MYCVEINGISLEIETAEGIFSPKSADSGTLAMLAETEILPADRVLDLGCGCGIVGIYCAKTVGEERVSMCDISPEAVEISRKNAERNGVGKIKIYQGDGLSALPDEKFTLILSNPPYHADFSVAKGFIEGGFRRLELGGRLVMVAKRREWYKNKLCAVFGGVKIAERGGYFVFTAQKRSAAPPKRPKPPAPGLSKKLRKKFEKTKQTL